MPVLSRRQSRCSYARLYPCILLAVIVLAHVIQSTTISAVHSNELMVIPFVELTMTFGPLSTRRDPSVLKSAITHLVMSGWPKKILTMYVNLELIQIRRHLLAVDESLLGQDLIQIGTVLPRIGVVIRMLSVTVFLERTLRSGRWLAKFGGILP